MGLGDLVKNLRASIGIPKGTIGLIISKHKSDGYEEFVYRIQWLQARMRYGPRLEMDLELVE